jgi:hypothetical protein
MLAFDPSAGPQFLVHFSDTKRLWHVDLLEISPANVASEPLIFTKPPHIPRAILAEGAPIDSGAGLVSA